MRALGLVFLGATICAGCSSKSKAPEPVDSEQARQLVHDALESWKRGDTPEMLRDRSPSIHVADEDWQAGARLTRFEIKEMGDVTGVSLRSRVTLYLKDRGGQSLTPRTVEYNVSSNSFVRLESP